MVECGVDLEGHNVMLRVLRAEIVDVVMVVKDCGIPCVVYVLLDVLLDHRVVEAAAATATETGPAPGLQDHDSIDVAAD